MVTPEDIYEIDIDLARFGHPGRGDGYRAARKAAEEWFHGKLLEHDHGGIAVKHGKVVVSLRGRAEGEPWLPLMLSQARLVPTREVRRVIAEKAASIVLGRPYALQRDTVGEIHDGYGRTIYRVTIKGGAC